jgi:hypothetical protein
MMAFLWEGSMRCLTRLVVVFAFCSHLGLDAADKNATEQPAVTFVQITDAHVFDDGYRQYPDATFRQAGDDWASLHWAIGKINELADAEGKIDFIVFTGDLGLQNVELRDLSKEPCKLSPGGVDGSGNPDFEGQPVITKDWAAVKLSRELNTLAVRTVYVVPGNNDLVNELVPEATRLECFLGELNSRLSAFSAALPVKLIELRVSNPIPKDKFLLVGFNSASFKNEGNYKGFCPAYKNGCPEWEINQLRALKPPENSDREMVLFTHVPDLNDPYRKDSSWKISPKLRDVWEALACDPKVGAIFAGHFHDSDRNLYGNTSGTRTLTIRECVARKTWVAPPLAIKNQEGKNPTARGLLLVKLFRTGEPEVRVYWYGEPGVSAFPSRMRAQCSHGILWIALVSLVIFALFGVFVSLVGKAHGREA